MNGTEEIWEKTVTRDFAVGRTVGEYVIRRRIGEGGMGIVYEAEHPQIGRRVAIKVLRPDLTVTRDLLGEARAASAIRHRHIIDVFGFGELDGLGQYMIMDFLEGDPLDEEIRAKAPMRSESVIPILDDTLAALSAAHAKGVIHRDLKPGNLFLVHESSGTRYVKVLDFGLAKATMTPLPPEKQTREGIAMGTPEYMSPEQAQAHRVDGRTDLYALGVIAFEMLTGRLPFEGDTPLAIALKQVHEAPPRLRSIIPDIPVAMEQLVLSLLAKDPAARPPTAEAVRAELKRLRRELAAEPTPIGRALPPEAFENANTEIASSPLAETIDAPAVAAPDTQPEPPSVVPPRRPVLPFALGVSALALAGIAMFALAQRSSTSTTTTLPLVQPPPPPKVDDPPPVAKLPSPVVEPPPPEPVDDPTPAPAVVKPKPQPAPVKKPGQLQITARGCSVEVTIDGKSLGHTPKINTVTLPSGDHVVELANAFCTPESIKERVKISSGTSMKFERTFQKK